VKPSSSRTSLRCTPFQQALAKNPLHQTEGSAMTNMHATIASVGTGGINVEHPRAFSRGVESSERTGHMRSGVPPMFADSGSDANCVIVAEDAASDADLHGHE
jgi:hypothetical protein